MALAPKTVFDTDIPGTVVAGHRVASGLTNSSPYPAGTIQLQHPHFKALGLDLSAYFFGTLNIDISPYQFALQHPQWTFEQVKWSPDHAAETFSFTPCQVQWQHSCQQGLIYYPHPETKLNHFQSPSTVEVLLPELSGIEYGDRVRLRVNARELIIL